MRSKEEQIDLAKKFLKKKLGSNFQFLDVLGEGGNAIVVKVKDLRNSHNVALKFLEVKHSESKNRFLSEIEILNDVKSKGILGVMPIIESSIDDFWYTMPIAQTIEHYLSDKDFIFVVSKIVSLANVLSILHSNGISHRDIKPDNIYFYNRRVVLADFGLASFPNKVDVTKSYRGVGAIFTIAPEMLRYPDTADGKKADVYSLAKTLWILLSDEKKGFDGSYDYLNSEISLRNHLKYKELKKEVHLVELERLLKKATEYDPEKRPSMSEFRDLLKKYVNILKNKEKSLESDWKFLGELLFDQFIPKSAKWKDPAVISRVLKAAGCSPAIKQMMNVEGNEIPLDEIFLNDNNELSFKVRGLPITVQPSSMLFERFNDYHYNYFLLEISRSSLSRTRNAYFKGPFVFTMKSAPFLGFYRSLKGKSSKELPKKFLDYVCDLDQKGKMK